MTDAAGTPHTLETAVRIELARGETRDAGEITARLVERYGQTWLRRQLVNIVARIIAGGAARSTSASIGSGRPSNGPGVSSTRATRSLRRVRKVAGDVAADFLDRARWVSADVGWKRVADLTAADCRAIAAQYELLADRAGEHCRWFTDAAAAIDAEGVETVGEVQRRLTPPSELTAAETKMISARAGHGTPGAQ